MKRLLSYSLAVSSLITFVSCDSSDSDQSSNKKEPIRLEVREDEEELPAEEKVIEIEALPSDSPLVADETEVSPEPVVDYEYFQKALAPFGTWYETKEYGPVWQPLASREANWAPYTRGQWVYCDQGWSWVSSEDFGWATYHYGRWAKLQTQGWVWVPGTEWAPNWCSWRSSDDYIGWAPLPPETLAFPYSGWDSSVESRYGITVSCYNFVKSNHFDGSIISFCLPASRITSCFNVTRNITDIRFHNNRIFCGGPVYRDLSGRLGRRLPFCQLKRSHDFSRKAISVRLRNRVEGDELIVNAPKVRSTGPLQTRAQQIAVKVQRGKDADPRAIEAFREMRQREVTTGRNRIAVQESGKRTISPTKVRPGPKSRVTGNQPSSKATEEAAVQRKLQAEITRRQQQEAMARQRARAQQEVVEREAAERQRIDAQRRQRELAQRKQAEEMQRQRMEAQRKQREAARRQQEEEEEREAIATERARRSEREAMQRKQREAAQREQEEEERRERIAEQKRQREQARREQEEEARRQRIAEQRKAREDMQRRQREEFQRQKEAEEQRRRIEEQKKQREEAARRRREEEAKRQKEAEEQRRRIEEQKRQREEAERRREEAERKRQEEEQRQRVEEQRRAREEARRRQREETERQRKKADPSRRRGK